MGSNRFRRGCAVAAALVAVGCSSSPQGTSATCGIACSGDVTCDNGDTGTAASQSGACVLTGANGTLKLACDSTLQATDPQGNLMGGTWSGAGTSLTVTLPGQGAFHCTIAATSSSVTPPGSQNPSVLQATQRSASVICARTQQCDPSGFAAAFPNGIDECEEQATSRLPA